MVQILSRCSVNLTAQAVALWTNMGQRLRLYVPDDDASRLCRGAFLSLMDRERDLESIYLVDKPNAADFELAMENEKVIFSANLADWFHIPWK